MKILYIIRGLPSSGKSTLAKKLVGSSSVIEADQYFVDIEGNYKFIPEQIKYAHAYCKDWASIFMRSSISDLAVANTFTQLWEYQPYLGMCKKYGYKPVIIECHGRFKSIHNVPDDAIQRMKDRWEPTTIGE